MSLAAFRTFPSSRDHRPSAVRFRLPLDGPVTVAWGGPTLDASYHAIMPDHRWACDLSVPGQPFPQRGAFRSRACLRLSLWQRAITPTNLDRVLLAGPSKPGMVKANADLIVINVD